MIPLPGLLTCHISRWILDTTGSTTTYSTLFYTQLPIAVVRMLFSFDLTRLALGLAVIPKPAWSLHLWNSPKELPESFPDACRSALSRNITCSQLVPGIKAASQAPYGEAELGKLCIVACSNSLKQFQQGVYDGCGDQALTFNGTSTTGPQLADPLVWAHNVTCLQDS